MASRQVDASAGDGLPVLQASQEGLDQGGAS